MPRGRRDGVAPCSLVTACTCLCGDIGKGEEKGVHMSDIEKGSFFSGPVVGFCDA